MQPLYFINDGVEAVAAAIERAGVLGGDQHRAADLGHAVKLGGELGGQADAAVRGGAAGD